jgi:hypothetical protein
MRRIQPDRENGYAQVPESTKAWDVIIKGDGAVTARVNHVIGKRKARPLAVFPGIKRIDDAGRS